MGPAQVVAHLGRSDLAVACSDAGDDDGGGGGGDEMTVFHFLNCAALTFGPHVVYYSATPLSEYDTIGTCVKAAVVYLGTALVKLVCLATLLKVPENDSFDPYQELMKIFIGFIDVAGLYFALTQLTHRNISQNHKFQAVGLGWAFADSVLHRLAPLWIGARGLEFTWEYIFQGLEANANLVMTLSLAALGSLMWLRKNKPRTLLLEEIIRVADSKGGWLRAVLLTGHGFHQLAAVLSLSETNFMGK
uniref:BOS complex subunit TMEM147 n=1 Tax=Oryza glumipatula TaxID=40148 RepID=A0A0D9ZDM0_9ORYZ